MPRARLALLLVLLVGSGCALSSTPTTDAGDDASLPPPADAGIDVGLDAACDLTPEPAPLPAFHASFQLNDPLGGMAVPTMTGGDPVGVWLFDHGTFWVDQEGASMFNRYASSVSGTAWIAIDAADFRLDYVFDATLVGTAIGTIERDSITRAHARWRLDHEQIEPTGLVCETSTEPAYGDPGRVTFTRDDADHLTLLTEVPMMTGLTIIEMHGTRMP